MTAAKAAAVPKSPAKSPASKPSVSGGKNKATVNHTASRTEKSDDRSSRKSISEKRGTEIKKTISNTVSHTNHKFENAGNKGTEKAKHIEVKKETVKHPAKPERTNVVEREKSLNTAIKPIKNKLENISEMSKPTDSQKSVGTISAKREDRETRAELKPKTNIQVGREVAEKTRVSPQLVNRKGRDIDPAANPFYVSSKNVAKGSVNELKSIGEMVVHPVQTVENMGYAVTHPVETGKVIKESLGDVVNDKIINGNIESRSEVIGEVITELALAKGISVVSKGGKIAETANIASKTEEAGKLAAKTGKMKTLAEGAGKGHRLSLIELREIKKLDYRGREAHFSRIQQSSEKEALKEKMSLEELKKDMRLKQAEIDNLKAQTKEVKEPIKDKGEGAKVEAEKKTVATEVNPGITKESGKGINPNKVEKKEEIKGAEKKEDTSNTPEVSGKSIESGLKSIDNTAITHSSVGDFTYNPKTGAVSKMKGGGHGQANIEFLEANGLEYNIVKVYDNGVRIGNIPDHKVKAKRTGTNQSWFPESWSESDIANAGAYIGNLPENVNAADGVTVFGNYNGVRVGVIRTNGRISTIFPDAASQP